MDDKLRYSPKHEDTMRRLTIMLIVALCATQSFAGTYYVDGANGDDARDGTSPATAWRSLERANQLVLQSGDQLLFKAGMRYTGQLRPQGSGSMGDDGKPLLIRIGKYGEGDLPRIDGEGRVLDTLLL